jgi:hypothetical protein
LDTSPTVEELEKPGSDDEKEKSAKTEKPHIAIALKNPSARFTSAVSREPLVVAARFFDFRGALAFFLAVVVATYTPFSLILGRFTVPRSP